MLSRSYLFASSATPHPFSSWKYGPLHNPNSVLCTPRWPCIGAFSVVLFFFGHNLVRQQFVVRRGALWMWSKLIMQSLTVLEFSFLASASVFGICNGTTSLLTSRAELTGASITQIVNNNAVVTRIFIIVCWEENGVEVTALLRPDADWIRGGSLRGFWGR